MLAVLGSEDMFDRAFEVSEYESRVPFAVAGLEVTAVPVDHYDIQAFGFRVKGDRTPAYSGDSGPSDAIAELARDADLLLSEATLENGGYDGPGARHLSPVEVQEAADHARAPRRPHAPPLRAEAPPESSSPTTAFESTFSGARWVAPAAKRPLQGSARPSPR